MSFRQLISLYLAVVLLLAVGLFSPVQATGGTFWVFSGTNQTGEARSFSLNPDRLVTFVGLRYNQNCSGTCDLIDNTVDSFQVDCSTWDDTDHVNFYLNDNGTGTNWDMNPVYPSGCSNGLWKQTVPSSWRNQFSSMTTHETGG